MGFYAPAQIIRDAREHGVEVRGWDVNASHWDCTLEDGALRLGLRMINGFQEAWALRLVAARVAGFADFQAFAGSSLPRAALEHLAQADALQSLGLTRRLALWRIAGLESKLPTPLLAGQPRRHITPDLPVMSQGEHVIADYRSTGLSLRAHPCGLLRARLVGAKCLDCLQATSAKHGALVRTAGIVTVRQRPGTAKGTVFVTIEDETGIANIIVWPAMVEKFRHQIINATLLIVQGRLQRSEENITHIIAERLVDRSRWITGLDAPMARADELPHIRRPPGHPRKERIVQKSRDFH
jgi:error-prone DNA polymerase